MFDFLKKTHKITYASVSFDGTRPYNEDSLKILDTERRKLFILVWAAAETGNLHPRQLWTVQKIQGGKVQVPEKHF